MDVPQQPNSPADDLVASKHVYDQYLLAWESETEYRKQLLERRKLFAAILVAAAYTISRFDITADSDTRVLWWSASLFMASAFFLFTGDAVVPSLRRLNIRITKNVLGSHSRFIKALDRPLFEASLPPNAGRSLVTSLDPDPTSDGLGAATTSDQAWEHRSQSLSDAVDIIIEKNFRLFGRLVLAASFMYPGFVLLGWAFLVDLRQVDN